MSFKETEISLLGSGYRREGMQQNKTCPFCGLDPLIIYRHPSGAVVKVCAANGHIIG